MKKKCLVPLDSFRESHNNKTSRPSASNTQATLTKATLYERVTVTTSHSKRAPLNLSGLHSAPSKVASGIYYLFPKEPLR